MFLYCHTDLKIIQRDNVCQCGACRSAVNLTLKFVSHFGTLEEVTRQNFSKIRIKSNANIKKARANLVDSYVNGLLYAGGIDREFITPGLTNLKRIQIKLTRKIRTNKNG